MVQNLQIGLAKGEDMLVDEVTRKVLLPLTSTGKTDFGPLPQRVDDCAQDDRRWDADQGDSWSLSIVLLRVT